MWEAYKLKKISAIIPLKYLVSQVLTVAYTTSWLATMFLVLHNVPCFPCKTLAIRNKLYKI